MRDPYLIDEKVGEIADLIEQTQLSPENGHALHQALVDAGEATGAPLSTIAKKLAKVLHDSDKIRPARKDYLANWLAKYVPYATRR